MFYAQEAPMCRSVRAQLTPSEHKEAVRLAGIMIPVYASIAVFIVAALVITHQPRTGETVAAVADRSASNTGSGGR